MKFERSAALSFLFLASSFLGVADASGGALRAVAPETTTAEEHHHQHPDVSAVSSVLSSFRSWVKTHSKTYETKEEEAKRLKIWLENHERIEAHNNNNLQQGDEPSAGYTLGHNEYSDLTQEEFAQRFRLGKYAEKRTSIHGEDSTTTTTARHLEEEIVGLPDYVNWVQMGGVTDVKNQGPCGSCWAFSTTGALEGAKFVRTGELVALSEQNLLDCDHKDMGCRGGLMDNAFKFDEKSGGLCSESDYPYQGKQNSVCNPKNCTDVEGTEVSTFYDVPPGKTDALLAALAMQPISVAIQANQFVFQFYKGGVLTDDSCGSAGQLDHGVLAVGYGSDIKTNHPYFLIKNSWGPSWGEDGYIRLSRKSKNQYGMCAVLKMASYPEVK